VNRDVCTVLAKRTLVHLVAEKAMCAWNNSLSIGLNLIMFDIGDIR